MNEHTDKNRDKNKDKNKESNITSSEPTMDFNQAEELMKKTMSDLFKHGVRSLALIESDNDLFLSDNGITEKAITEKAILELFLSFKIDRPSAFDAVLDKIEDLLKGVDNDKEADRKPF